MIARTAPMGWNSWNTFGANISDALVREMADAMVEKGYRDAGYEYLVIDDCWSLRERGADGRLVPDPEKFPYGMKAVADYVHSKGLKFGMYSCAGVRTCAGYPASFDHEFVDAATFAEWGVDFLKYDFCNFPANGDCKMRYQTMSMALKATGREILFSACNWGQQEPWHWMRSIGAHMYRSTGDILDNFVSFTNIAQSQLPNFCDSGNSCFTDIDMLTGGMYGKGNVGIGKVCTDAEYRVQFTLWCMLSAPLMMGGDLRSMNDFCADLLRNPQLIAIDQDEEARPPYVVQLDGVTVTNPNPPEGEHPWSRQPETSLTLLKHLSDGEFILGYYNLSTQDSEIPCIFADCGLPYASGYGFAMTDVLTGEDIGVKRDFYNPVIPAHDCRLFRCRLVRC